MTLNLIKSEQPHRFEVGQVVTFPARPTRWDRFLHWLIKRPYPQRLEHYRIVGTTCTEAWVEEVGQ